MYEHVLETLAPIKTLVISKRNKLFAKVVYETHHVGPECIPEFSWALSDLPTCLESVFSGTRS